MMFKIIPDKLGNKGFSLVEVIVAVAIASIVVGGVASLIFTSLNLFGKNNANAEVQNELQTSMNLVSLTIMEAEGLAYILPDGFASNPFVVGSVGIALLGDLKYVEDKSSTPATYRMAFKGSAIIHDEAANRRFLYLVDMEEFLAGAGGYTRVNSTATHPDYHYFYITSAAATKDEAKDALLTAIPALRTAFLAQDPDDEGRLMWFLGQYIQHFSILPSGDPATIMTEAGISTDILMMETRPYGGGFEDYYYFTEPFNLTVTINVLFRNGNTDYERALVQDVALRSRVKSIFIGDAAMRDGTNPTTGYPTTDDPKGYRGMQEYKRR